jgi:GNAT superfamily N-acetyltransferase
MIHDHFVKLDNPAWWALTGVQQSFADGGAIARRYRRGVLPFAAFDHTSPENVTALDEWLETGEVFFLIGMLPPLPSHWQLITELPCVQMVLQPPVSNTLSETSVIPPAAAEPSATSIIPPAPAVPTETSIIPPAAADPSKTSVIPLTAADPSKVSVIPLTAADRDDMFNLVTKVQPGYYQPDTYQLGRYFGIRQEGQLVAIAGERIRLEGLTEISAVCTDPAYTGRGYAQQLTAHVCQVNLEQGITPFLHTLTTNQRAIRLYEYLGFKQRRVISFWKLMKGRRRL